MMPLRSRIHSSLESMFSQISAFVTIRVGRCSPIATMRAPGAPGRTLMQTPPSCRHLGMDAGQRLSGGDRVAVLDQPFDQRGVVLRNDFLRLSPGDDSADDRASLQVVADRRVAGLERSG